MLDEKLLQKVFEGIKNPNKPKFETGFKKLIKYAKKLKLIFNFYNSSP